jgi:hypothetical protein
VTVRAPLGTIAGVEDGMDIGIVREQTRGLLGDGVQRTGEAGGGQRRAGE